MIPSFSLGAVLRSLGIGGVAAILFAVGFGFAMWRSDTFSDRLKVSQANLVGEKMAHSITAASLAKVEEDLKGYIKEGKIREKAAREALKRQETVAAGLSLEIERIRAERAAGGKPEADDGQCLTGAAVMQAKGL